MASAHSPFATKLPLRPEAGRAAGDSALAKSEMLTRGGASEHAIGEHTDGVNSADSRHTAEKSLAHDKGLPGAASCPRASCHSYGSSAHWSALQGNARA
jgi:hypothetical protein